MVRGSGAGGTDGAERVSEVGAVWVGMKENTMPEAATTGTILEIGKRSFTSGCRSDW